MGLYARRLIQAVFLILGGITIVLTITGHGSARVYLTCLSGVVMTWVLGVGAELMRSDRGIIAATRIVLATMREAEKERSKEGPDETGNVYKLGG